MISSPISYASLADTTDTLVSLGFTDDAAKLAASDPIQPMSNTVATMVTSTGRTRAVVYVCAAGYHCVSFLFPSDTNPTTGAWQAPIVWTGPQAKWDTATNQDLKEEVLLFIKTQLHYWHPDGTI